jgi:two-component system chemotaxis response regulator CheB
VIRVLVVDDSPLVRKVVSDILSGDPGISVCATASTAEIALRKLEKEKPDVITMDIEMPGMGGVEGIGRIMARRPTAVIVLSALAQKGAEETIRALERGAVDFIQKPSASPSGGVAQVARELVEKVKEAARVHPRHLRAAAAEPAARALARPAPGSPDAGPCPPFEIVAIGASTGGPMALKTVLRDLPADFPAGVAVVQHMPAVFTGAFAARLNGLCALSVKEAEEGDEILAGRVLVAPGGRHMTVTRADGRCLVRLSDDDPVSGHRPSVDVLMASVAEEYGCSAVGVIMTGMGKDGARGIARLRERGGWVIAQDEESSVVFGMNGEVVRNGHAHRVEPVHAIAGVLRERVAGKGVKT